MRASARALAPIWRAYTCTSSPPAVPVASDWATFQATASTPPPRGSKRSITSAIRMMFAGRRGVSTRGGRVLYRPAQDPLVSIAALMLNAYRVRPDLVKVLVLTSLVLGVTEVSDDEAEQCAYHPHFARATVEIFLNGCAQGGSTR